MRPRKKSIKHQLIPIKTNPKYFTGENKFSLVEKVSFPNYFLTLNDSEITTKFHQSQTLQQRIEITLLSITLDTIPKKTSHKIRMFANRKPSSFVLTSFDTFSMAASLASSLAAERRYSMKIAPEATNRIMNSEKI